jgi:hypothetical protein
LSSRDYKNWSPYLDEAGDEDAPELVNVTPRLHSQADRFNAWRNGRNTEDQRAFMVDVLVATRSGRSALRSLRQRSRRRSS